MGIFEKFKIGFKKSASNLTAGFKEIIIKKEIDDHTLNKIEDFLISADVGVDAASDIKNIISQNRIDCLHLNSLCFFVTILECLIPKCFDLNFS